MREYDLDFSKDTIIVDGHICKALPDKPYVYEVQDDYTVTIGVWYFEDENDDLRIVIKTDLNEFPFNCKVIYVGNHDDESFKNFAESICNEDDSYMVYDNYQHYSNRV